MQLDNIDNKNGIDEILPSGNISQKLSNVQSKEVSPRQTKGEKIVNGETKMATPGAHPIRGIDNKSAYEKGKSNTELSYLIGLPAPEKTKSAEEFKNEVEGPGAHTAHGIDAKSGAKKEKSKLKLSYKEGLPAPDRTVRKEETKEEVKIDFIPGAHPIVGITSKNTERDISNKTIVSYAADVPAPERNENKKEEKKADKSEELTKSNEKASVEFIKSPGASAEFISKKVKASVFKNKMQSVDEPSPLIEAELAPNVDEVVNLAVKRAMAERDQTINLALKNMKSNMVTGTVVQAEKVESKQLSRCLRWIIVILLVLSILATTLGLYFGLRKENATETPSPSPKPPIDRYDSLKMAIGAFFDDGEGSSFPSNADQERALMWISKTDPRELPADSPPAVLLDRYFAAFLYTSLSGINWTKKVSWMSDVSICFWQGLGCNNQNLLSGIDLSNIGIDGFIPTDIGLMTNLEHLNLSNDEIKLNPHQKSFLRKSSSKHNILQSRIAGGTITNVGEYPYFVKIANRCGGSLIHEDLILSAAVCYRNETIPVTIGFHQRDNETEGVEYRTVIDGYIHPNHKGFDYDYSIMKLDKPVTNVDPIKLNTNQEIPSLDEKLTMIGFGQTVQGGGLSKFLREANVNIVDYATCNGIYGSTVNDDTMICAGLEGKGTCAGDSGGPVLTQSGIQVGLTSWGAGDCGQRGFPNVVARVSRAIDWIDYIICVISENPPASCSVSPFFMPSPSSSPTQQLSYAPSYNPTQQSSYAPSHQSKQLLGTLPTEIGKLTMLKSLDLSGNGLTGIIPTELGMLTELTFLSLNKNKFNGSIPIEMQFMLNNSAIDVKLDREILID